MKLSKFLFLLFFTTVVLSACSPVKTIFEAGMWWAFILVGLAIVIIVVIASKLKKK